MRNLRSVVFGFAAAAIVCPLAVAPPASAAEGAVVLKMSGDLGWSMRCVFEREGKGPLTKRARGRGGVKTLAADEVTGGSCTYKGPRKGVFTVKFLDEDEPEKCPFRLEGETCVGEFAAGDEGSFAF